jgi:hypothetical protein
MTLEPISVLNENFFINYKPLTLEKINLVYDKHLLDNLIKNPKDEDGNYIVELSRDEILELKNFRKDAKKLCYYEYKNKQKYGRVYHTTNIQRMKSVLRKTLLYQSYFDLDIVNCHPTLLLNLLKFHSLKCDELEKFVNGGRDHYINENFKYGISRETSKQNIQKAIFTCQSEEQELISLTNELQHSVIELKRLYPEVLDFVKGLPKNYNQEGTFLAYLLQTIENRIITLIFHYLRTEGIETGLILHDAVYIKRTKTLEDFEYIIDKVKNAVKQNFYGFDINFKLNDISTEALENHHKLKEDIRLNEKIIIDAYYEYCKGKPSVLILNNEVFCCNIENNLWQSSSKYLFKSIFEDASFNEYLSINFGSRIKYTNSRSWNELYNYFLLDERFVKDSLFEFDNDATLIAFKNKKCIQLSKNDKETPYIIRDLLPEDYCMMSVGYSLDESGINKEFPRELIKNCFQDNDTAETYLMILGSSIYGELLYKKFFLNKGSGNNGRSFISRLLHKCLGDYFGTCNSNFFTNAETDGDIKSPEIIENRKKRLITFNEPKSTNGRIKLSFDAEKIKLVSGGDIIVARPLNSNKIYKFINISTYFGNVNKLLNIPNIGAAERERIYIIPQNTEFCENPILPHQKKLINNSDFFNDLSFKNSVMFLLLEYWEKFVKNDLQLVFSNEIMEYTEEYLGDDINSFMMMNLESSINDFCRFKDVYERYCDTYKGDLRLLKSQKDFKESLVNKRCIIKVVNKVKDGERHNYNALLHYTLKEREEECLID